MDEPELAGKVREEAGLKVALVTGASRGIGREIALALAREGYDVAVHCRENIARARELAAHIHGRAVQADVADAAQVQAMVGEVLAYYGRVDLLVNNAGIAHSGLLTDLTTEEWRRLFAVNVDGAYYCTREVLPGMISRKQGCIVNISSIWGMRGASCEVAYSASKAALIGFTKALAQEVGPSGVRVNCVAPGVIETDMMEAYTPAEREALAQETPLMRLGSVQDVAGAVCFLASERAAFMTGQVLSPNGGMVL